MKLPNLKQERIPLVAGLAAGVLAVVLLQAERARWRAEADQGPKAAYLVVTSATAAGEAVGEGLLAADEAPRRYVHPLAVDPGDRDVVAGMPAAHPLRAGQPLLWSDLAPLDSDDGLTALVRPNERAVALRVNEVSGVGKLIRNNDHVDIFGTFDRDEGTVTVPVLQNVTVIATGRETRGAADDYQTLTVSVSPQEAALLTLAQETGRLTYVLRNGRDWDTAPALQRVSLADLFVDERRQAVQESRDIRIVKGRP